MTGHALLSRFNKRCRLLFRNCHEVVMHLSQLPISFSGLTISSLRAPASVVIAIPNGEMNLPWIIRRMPSYFVSPLVPDYDFVKGSRYATGAGFGNLTWLRGRARSVLAVLAFTSAGCLRGPRRGP